MAQLRSLPVILFDGHCRFCNALVNFAIARDSANVLRFAPLQSDFGVALLTRHGLPTTDHDSVVFVEGEHVSTHSTAALRVALYFDGLWPLLFALVVIPRPLRDAVYGVVATWRYRVWGQTDHCPLPSAAIRRRFLG